MFSRFFSFRQLLIYFCLGAVLLWFYLQSEVDRRFRAVLQDVSAQMVAPVSYGSISLNPFKQEILVEDLKVPQRRLVGVDDSILSQASLIHLNQVSIKIDFKKYFQEEKWVFPSIVISDLKLGAVVGPEIKRIDLMYLPGIFLGLIPGQDGKLTKRIPYEIAQLTVDQLEVTFTPSSQSRAEPVVLSKGSLTAHRLSNRVLADDQVGAMGEIVFDGQVGPRGLFSFRGQIDSFYNLFKRANGRVIVKAAHLPVTATNLFVESLGFQFRFTSGEMDLDIDMDINKSKWVRRKDQAKLIQARVAPLGKYLDPISRRLVDELRHLSGNTRFEYWLSGSLGSFRAGPYFFNPSQVF